MRRITTDEFAAVSRSWLAVGPASAVRAALPADGVSADAGTAQPAGPPSLLLLDLLGRRHGLHAVLGRRRLRAAAAPGDRQRGATEFRVGPGGPELVKGHSIQVINDGPQKPSSIHQHIGQRPLMAAGNTDGDLAMLQWTAGGPHRTLPWSCTTPTANGNTPTTMTRSWAAARNRSAPRPPTTSGPSSTWPRTGRLSTRQAASPASRRALRHGRGGVTGVTTPDGGCPVDSARVTVAVND